MRRSHGPGAASPLILCYHGVIDDAPPLDDFCFLPLVKFRAQMAFISRIGARILDLEEAVRCTHEGTLPRRAIVLTFDDGFLNNVSLALPVMERCGIPATVYLNTGFTDTGHGTWSSRLTHALQVTEKWRLEWGSHTFELRDMNSKKRARSTLGALIKESNPDNPASAVGEIERALGQPVNPVFCDTSPYRMMGTKEVRRAQATGLMKFGAHTRTHPIVSALDDEQLESEIDGSVRDVERISGAECKSFAFPNGRKQDFDDRSLSRLRALGIEIVLATTSPKPFGLTESLPIGRMVIGSGLPLPLFAWRVFRALQALA